MSVCAQIKTVTASPSQRYECTATCVAGGMYKQYFDVDQIWYGSELDNEVRSESHSYSWTKTDGSSFVFVEYLTPLYDPGQPTVSGSLTITHWCHFRSSTFIWHTHRYMFIELTLHPDGSYTENTWVEDYGHVHY